jgi:hypothetical protein
MLKDKIRKKKYLIKKIKWTRVNQANLQWKLYMPLGPVNFLSQILFFYLIIQR